MLLLGSLDDLRGVGPATKLAWQTLAALIAVYGGYGFHALTNPIGGGVVWLGPLSTLLSVAWIVVVTNAFNLIDGLDGLAAGTGLIAAVTLFLVALSEDRPDAAVMAVTLAGVLAGFLRFNFAPASIFLGDAGSLLLGYLLSVLSIQSLQKGPTAVVDAGADPHPRPADPRGGGDGRAALARRRHRIGVPRRSRAHPPPPARPRHDPPPRRAAAVGGVRRLRRAGAARRQRPRPRQRRDRRRRGAGDRARPAPARLPEALMRRHAAALAALLLAAALVTWIRLLPLSLPALPDLVTAAARQKAAKHLPPPAPGTTVEARGRAIDEWIAAHPGEHAATLADEAKRLDDAFHYKDARGRSWVYLGDLDSYAWLRAARNVLEHGTPCDAVSDGECRDTLTLAPVGLAVPLAHSLHVAAIATVQRVATWIDPDFPLPASAFLVPVIAGLLGVVACVRHRPPPRRDPRRVRRRRRERRAPDPAAAQHRQRQ